MQTLNDAVVIENCNRWEVAKCYDKKDDDPPKCEVEINFYHVGVGLKVYKTVNLIAYDSLQSVIVQRADQGAALTEKISVGNRTVLGAYTAISNANKSAGNRSAQKLAVEAACKGTLVDVNLAST